MPLPAENLLGSQTSPYLRQHQGNPVHWRPWSKAALEEARELNRPILLSIGYAACHWCHVMAHESFEDEAVAEVMNRLFVNIKVDREERPDIDQIYMSALHATGEQGGWPLTMFLTPDARPFWGGTYFPKAPRYGRPGFVQVLEAIHKAWTEKSEEIGRSAGRLAAHVEAQLAGRRDLVGLSPAYLREMAAVILGATDLERGGLKGAPKFPNAPFMTTLWLDWLSNGNTDSRAAFLGSLAPMLDGGIYDHVGGGLSRYSTDADWLVPHFEKMLYDNAQLVRHCAWAYAETGQGLFRSRIEETIGWLLREMRPGGTAFASSLDADSAGEEGLFYTWKREEVERVLGAEADAFFRTYRLDKPAAWEGDPILHRMPRPDGPTQAERAMLDRLGEARASRVRPGRDDKILVDWNGLAIRALAEASRQFGRSDWLQAAESAYRFVCESADAGRLPHSINDGSRLFPGLASDHAAMVNAALALFEATGDPAYVDHAQAWHAVLDAWHADGADGYYLTAADCDDVLMRVRGDADEAVPSATGQIIEALARLANILGDTGLAERAEAVAKAALGRMSGHGFGQAGLVNAAAILLDPHKLLIVESGDSRLVAEANRYPDPRRVDINVPIGSPGTAPLPGGILPDTTRAAAWLCREHACLPPIVDPEILADELRTRPAPASAG